MLKVTIQIIFIVQSINDCIYANLIDHKQCEKYSKTCEQCLAASNKCIWCADTNYVKGSNRSTTQCGSYDVIISECPQRNVINFASMITYTNVEHKNENSNTASDHESIWLTPKYIRADFRPNDPLDIIIDIYQSDGFPVDLYFLMDLSYSMADDLDNLSKLSKQLVTEMRVITKDFRLGFGSFVDKRLMPFSDISGSEFIRNTCPSQYDTLSHRSCVPAYSFKHHLSLTDDMDAFEMEVLNVPVAGNIDAPEGGLDGLMQVMACKDVIGWRNNSRKFIVYSTDAGMHIAGDGKLAGLITPCDEKCHLQRTYDEHLKKYVYMYTHAEMQDYPSLGSIYYNLAENDINLIFAVTRPQYELYKSISEFLENAVVGILENDSSNIVDLVTENYKKITNKIRMVMNTSSIINDSSSLVVDMSPNCSIENVSNECEIGLGKTLALKISITSKICLNNAINLSFHPFGMRSQQLIVEMNPLCNCTCANENNLDTLQSLSNIYCNGNGKFHCGNCQCNDGFYGDKCECNGNSASTEVLLHQCISPGSNVICYGRGQCICGRCKCFSREHGEQISGQYCECDNFSCPRYKGLVCAGKTNGVCQCDGSCKCHPGWSGEDCSCTTSLASCIANASQLVCNGIGTCECGKCMCSKKSELLTSTCEECTNCRRGCIDTKECARCRAFGTGILSSTQCRNCPYDIQLVNNLYQEEKDAEDRICQFEDIDRCTFYYSYHVENRSRRIRLRVLQEKTCPTAVSYWLITVLVASSVIIIGGMMLSVWRIIVTIHDRNEFSKFEKEQMATKLTEVCVKIRLMSNLSK
ncbi:hypothetical protein GJ496_005008 [Pomphorhynchus laevis]|nr:hypothetical protein GJ496_005008 [Pomphorhynchus laevis]